MLAFILSLPRSGSTVLTSMLDMRRGIISPPESSFPQVLGMLKPSCRSNRRKMAALYIASTFPGTPLTLDEAEQCMNGSDEEILTNIGRALAVKLGRKPEEITTVVWKTTRTISMNRGPLSTSAKFIVLRRHPHNVFESQFRVHFGLHNRKPFRFAAFRQSYEWAFGQLPKERTFQLDYDRIPERMGDLLSFLEVSDQGIREEGLSSLQHVAETRPWLSQILTEFRNDDPSKRARLDPKQMANLDKAISQVRLLNPLMPVLRHHYDQKTLQHIYQKAQKILAENR